MASGGAANKAVVFLAGGLLGFFIGYAMTYQGSATSTTVETSSAPTKTLAKVNAKPVRVLVDSPKKGGDKPKVIVQEVSEFQ